MLFLIDRCLPAANIASTVESIATATSTLIQGYQTAPRIGEWRPGADMPC